MQELVVAKEPLVLCGSKAISWNSLVHVIMNARTNEELDVDTPIHEILAMVRCLHSFWLDLWSKDSFYIAPQRQWVEALPDSWHRYALNTVLGVLERRSRVLVRVQAGIIASIIVSRMLQNQRPLDTAWLLLPIFSLGSTILLTPMRTDESWPQRVRDGMVTMLSLHRQRHATEPKDKVFSLHGVLHALGVPLQPAEYSRPLEEVYRTFTVQMILWLGSLNLLIEAGESGLVDSPSWVPDWRKELQRPIMRETASTSEPSFGFVEQDRVVETAALIIDSVETVMLEDLCLRRQYTYTESLDGSQQPQAAHADDVVDIVDWLHTADTTQGLVAAFPILHSVNEFLMYDDYESGLPKALFLRLLAIVARLLSNEDAAVRASLAEECVIRIRCDAEVSRYFHRLLLSIVGKRVFLKTSDGRLGSGPVSMRAGDSVALVAGLGCPMILRSIGKDRYRVIGATYVYGTMYGECWPAPALEVSKIFLV